MRTVPVAVLLLLAFALTSANNWRHNSRRFQAPCCTKYTTANMSQDVVGDSYTEPPVSYHCVKAVVLTTTRGRVCVNPKDAWVREVIANMTKL